MSNKICPVYYIILYWNILVCNTVTYWSKKRVSARDVRVSSRWGPFRAVDREMACRTTIKYARVRTSSAADCCLPRGAVIGRHGWVDAHNGRPPLRSRPAAEYRTSVSPTCKAACRVIRGSVGPGVGQGRAVTWTLHVGRKSDEYRHSRAPPPSDAVVFRNWRHTHTDVTTITGPSRRCPWIAIGVRLWKSLPVQL